MIFEESPCYYLSVDDDIYYCRDYAQRLIDKIDENGRKVAVGFHGYNLQRPFQRYTTGREVFYFQSKLAKTRTVDIIGTGTSAVWTGTLRFDVREWQYTNMVDPCFALEAARVAMPLLCIARPAKRLVTLDRNPKNAIWERALKDDSVQTELCREVLYLKQQKRDSHVQ